MQKEFPNRGEAVLGTVKAVNPFSIILTLDEYGGKEGMIHISEVAGKWVKDIRDFAKPGQKKVALVIRVDVSTSFIGLSLKKIKPYETENKMKEYKRELKAKKLFEMLAKNQNMTVEQTENEIGSVLKESFGELFKPFHLSLTPEGRETLKKKGIPERWIDAIAKISEVSMKIKEKTIKKELEISCLESNGIDIIKKVLIDVSEKFSINVLYISAPRYTLEINTKSPKLGEKTLDKAVEYIKQEIEKKSGKVEDVSK